jgi:hypothetical protein
MRRYSRAVYRFWALLFVAIVFVAFAERRVAETELNDVGTIRLENADDPDGDQIINRLTGLNDVWAPPLPMLGDGHVVVSLLSETWRPTSAALVLGSRGPPLA